MLTKVLVVLTGGGITTVHYIHYIPLVSEYTNQFIVYMFVQTDSLGMYRQLQNIIKRIKNLQISFKEREKKIQYNDPHIQAAITSLQNMQRSMTLFSDSGRLTDAR